MHQINDIMHRFHYACSQKSYEVFFEQIFSSANRVFDRIAHRPICKNWQKAGYKRL